MGWGNGIGQWDWGLEIEIGNWDWHLALGIVNGNRDWILGRGYWDWRLGLGIGIRGLDL